MTNPLLDLSNLSPSDPMISLITPQLHVLYILRRDKVLGPGADGGDDGEGEEGVSFSEDVVLDSLGGSE